MKKRLFCAFVIAVCLYAVSAAGDESWKQFTTADGLPANEIRAIAEDANGVLWFGTEGGGVARYDGENWVVYGEKDGLACNEARKLSIDKDGVLWVCTPRGISSFDGNIWKTFNEKDGLASSYAVSVAIDAENRKWFGTYGKGVMRFDGKTWETFSTKDGLADDYVTAIAFDGDGAVWFGTHNGVTTFDGSTWVSYTTENSGLPNNYIPSLYIDNNIKWFGTGSGVARFDGNTWEVFTAQSKYDILEDRTVLSITMNNSGILWCGTSTGLWSFDGQLWTSYTRFDSELKDDSNIWSICIDKQGNKWFGTEHTATVSNANSVPRLKRSAVPAQMKIAGSYPNPFNPATTIEYFLPDNEFVKITVYNITGQKVRTLLSQDMIAGNHTILWNGTNDSGSSVASGVFIFRLEAGKTALSHRMMLVR